MEENSGECFGTNNTLINVNNNYGYTSKFYFHSITLS